MSNQHYLLIETLVTLFHYGYRQTGTLANSEDPDEMSHKLGSSLFTRVIHHSIESLTRNSLIYKIDFSIFINPPE